MSAFFSFELTLKSMLGDIVRQLVNKLFRCVFRTIALTGGVPDLGKDLSARILEDHFHSDTGLGHVAAGVWDPAFAFRSTFGPVHGVGGGERTGPTFHSGPVESLIESSFERLDHLAAAHFGHVLEFADLDLVTGKLHARGRVDPLHAVAFDHVLVVIDDSLCEIVIFVLVRVDKTVGFNFLFAGLSWTRDHAAHKNSTSHNHSHSTKHEILPCEIGLEQRFG